MSLQVWAWPLETLNSLSLSPAGLQSLPDLLSTLERCIEARKRKNVEVLWVAAMVTAVFQSEAGTDVSAAAAARC